MDNPSRRTFTKLIAAALAVLPLASADDAFGQSRKSRKSRKRKGNAPVDILQSSPITVGGGGSVGIDFSGHHFIKKGNEYTRDQDTLHKLWLIDKYGALENITPLNEDCIINIQCSNKQGKVSTITILGVPLKIAFDAAVFKKSKPADGKKELHHNKDYKIISISVHDKVTSGTMTYDAPTGGNCTIVVVNSL